MIITWRIGLLNAQDTILIQRRNSMKPRVDAGVEYKEIIH